MCRLPKAATACEHCHFDGSHEEALSMAEHHRVTVAIWIERKQKYSLNNSRYAEFAQRQIDWHTSEEKNWLAFAEERKTA
jgi:hypothetical protein